MGVGVLPWVMPGGGVGVGVLPWVMPGGAMGVGVWVLPWVMLGGAAGLGLGASTPRAAGSALRHPPPPHLLPVAPGSREQAVLGVCEEDSASGPHFPAQDFSPLAQYNHPVFQPPRAGDPGLVPVENPFPSAPGSVAPPAALLAARAPALHWALSARQSG